LLSENKFNVYSGVEEGEDKKPILLNAELI